MLEICWTGPVHSPVQSPESSFYRDPDSRITKLYAALICLQAVRQNLVYPDYGWITWHGEKSLWNEPNFLNDCTEEEVKEFIQRSQMLSIVFFLDSDDSDIPTASCLVRQYNKELSVQRNKPTEPFALTIKTINCQM